MTQWTNPKTWVAGEELTDEEFNVYIRDNFTHLKNGNIAMVEIRDGISDYSIPSTATWHILFPSVFKLLIATSGRDLHIEANFDMYSTNNGVIPSYDFRITPLDNTGVFWVSSGTGTPSNRGIATYTSQANHSISNSFGWVQRGLPAGGYIVHMGFKVSSGNLSINLTNHVNQFMAREAGVMVVTV